MNAFSLDFDYAYGKPCSTAVFRRSPEDFVVQEHFAESLSGDGEHFWLKIKKRGENTDWIAKKLANYFCVRALDVGYAGKKDRHAITTQWFSVYLPKREHEIDWSAFIEMAKVDAELLDVASHKSKLRRGDHSNNTFVITLHDVEDTAELVSRLEEIKHQGVPNYFGEQRFGRDGGNIEKVCRWIEDPRSIRNKNLRNIIVSAARSYLFNRVLSTRVADQSWQVLLDGDTQSSPSGPLWGRGRTLVSKAVAQREDEILKGFWQWREALETVGLQQERRDLAVRPQSLSWEAEHAEIVIEMTLNPGQYATSVLRELAILHNAS